VKSTVNEIRERFDHDVERFSNLETGQSATVDAPLALDLIAEAAVASTPQATRLLDIGCGAGNYTLKLLQRLPNLQITIIDLSQPMLNRAQERISQAGCSNLKCIQGDIREIDLEKENFDIILSAAVLHHLRNDQEWEQVFQKCYSALSPGGSWWIFDMLEGASKPLHQILWRRYGEYLSNLKDEKYRDHVFAYIEKEDTPRPLMHQLELLRRVGFDCIEVLHKNSCFAAFGGVKNKNMARG
jgi:tRNA (cmo5U34)-methyltransferase